MAEKDYIVSLADFAVSEGMISSDQKSDFIETMRSGYEGRKDIYDVMKKNGYLSEYKSYEDFAINGLNLHARQKPKPKPTPVIQQKPAVSHQPSPKQEEDSLPDRLGYAMGAKTNTTLRAWNNAERYKQAGKKTKNLSPWDNEVGHSSYTKEDEAMVRKNMGAIKPIPASGPVDMSYLDPESEVNQNVGWNPNYTGVPRHNAQKADKKLTPSPSQLLNAPQTPESKRAMRRMKDKMDYARNTGKSITEDRNYNFNVPLAEPVVGRDKDGNMMVDEDGNPLMGYESTDYDEVERQKQDYRETLLKSIIDSEVVGARNEAEEEGAAAYEAQNSGSVHDHDVLALSNMGASRTDSPESILQRLKDRFGFDYENGTVDADKLAYAHRDELASAANKLGVPVNDLLQDLNEVAGGYMAQKFGEEMSDKYAVKNEVDFISRGLSKYSPLTPMANRFLQEESMKSASGQGGKYNASEIAKFSQEVAMFAGDSPFIMASGGAGGLATKFLGRAATRMGMRTIGTLIESGASNFVTANMGSLMKYGGSVLNGMVRGMGSMGTFMGSSAVMNDLSVGETSLSQLGKDFIGGFTEGQRFGAATGMFGGMSAFGKAKLRPSVYATKFGYGMAAFAVENQLFAGMDYIKDPNEFDWAESSKDALYMQLAGKLSSAHGITEMATSFTNMFKKGAPLVNGFKLTDKDLSDLSRAFGGMNAMDIGKDPQNLKKILSDSKNIPWVLRMKFSGSCINTLEFKRPRTDNTSIRGKQVVERDSNGNLIETHNFNTEEEAKAIMADIQDRKLNDDMFAKYTMLNMSLTRSEIEQAKNDVVVEATMTNLDFPLETLDAGGKNYQLVIDRAMENRKGRNPGDVVIEEVAKANDMTADEVKALMVKGPKERTEQEQSIVDEVSAALDRALSVEPSVRPEQSRTQGADVAGDEPVMDQDTVEELASNVRVAEDEYNTFMGANTDIKEYIEEMTGKPADQLTIEDVVNIIGGIENGFSGDKREEAIRVISNLFNAREINQGYIDKVGRNIDAYVTDETENNSFRGRINGQSQDSIITITDGETRYNVVSGDIDVREDGTIDADNSQGVIIARDEEGNFVTFTPHESLRIESTTSKEDYANGIRTTLEETASQTAVESGLVQVPTEEKTKAENKKQPETPNNKSQEKEKSIEQPKRGSAEKPKEEITITLSDGTVVPAMLDPNNSPIPDYTKMTPEQGAKVAKEYFGDDAEKFVDGQIERATNEIENVIKMEIDYTQPNNEVLAAQKKKIDFTNEAQVRLDAFRKIKDALNKPDNQEPPATGGASVEKPKEDLKETPYQTADKTLRQIIDFAKEKAKSGEYGEEDEAKERELNNQLSSCIGNMTYVELSKLNDKYKNELNEIDADGFFDGVLETKGERLLSDLDDYDFNKLVDYLFDKYGINKGEKEAIIEWSDGTNNSTISDLERYVVENKDTERATNKLKSVTEAMRSYLPDDADMKESRKELEKAVGEIPDEQLDELIRKTLFTTTWSTDDANVKQALNDIREILSNRGIEIKDGSKGITEGDIACTKNGYILTVKEVKKSEVSLYNGDGGVFDVKKKEISCYAHKKPKETLKDGSEKNNETKNNVPLKPKKEKESNRERRQHKKIEEAKANGYGGYLNLDEMDVPGDVYEMCVLNFPMGKLEWGNKVSSTGAVIGTGVRDNLYGKDAKNSIGNSEANKIRFALAKKGEGISIDKAAEEIYWSQDNSLHDGEHRYELSDIKNALLDLLSSSENKAWLEDYILDRRIENAKKASEAEFDQYSEEVAPHLHLTPEEIGSYEAYREAMVEEYKNLTDETINEIERIFAEAYETEEVIRADADDAFTNEIKNIGTKELNEYERERNERESEEEAGGSTGLDSEHEHGRTDSNVQGGNAKVRKDDVGEGEEVIGRPDANTKPKGKQENRSGSDSDVSGGAPRTEELTPKDEKEKEIVSTVEKKLTEEIKAQEQRVKEAKSALEKKQSKESDKATDMFTEDDALNTDGQLFNNSEMAVDHSIEGVKARTKAERDALAHEQQELDRLKSKQEHDARVRGALEEHRKQTSFDAEEKSTYEKSKEQVKRSIEESVAKGNMPDVKAMDKKIKEIDKRIKTLEDGAAVNVGSDEELKAVEEKVEELRGQRDAIKEVRDETVRKMHEDEAKDILKDFNGSLSEAKDLLKSIMGVNGREAEDLATSIVGIEPPSKSIGGSVESTPKEKAAKANADALNDTTLTDEEIDASSIDDFQKKLAKLYAKGNHSALNKVAYLNAYNDVRNRKSSTTEDSGTPNQPQLGSGGSEEVGGSGRTGGQDMPVDKVGSGEEDGELRGVQDGEGRTTPTTGEGGNKQVSGGESPDGGLRDGSGRPEGSGTDSVKRPNVRKPRADKGSGGDTKQPAAGTAESIAQHKKEIADLLAEFKKAGEEDKKSDTTTRFRIDGEGENNVHLNVDDMTPGQLSMLGRLISASGKLGYDYLKQGIRKFKEWKDKLIEDIGSIVKDNTGWTDAEIDAYAREVWECPYEIDGVTRTIGEWSSFLGQEEMRNRIKPTLEEKRELQRNATTETKVGDIDNIRESLPYLLPEQQEDVLRAETQMYSDDHNDREHGFGKGYMFTNGTGTGKTYTGLGIVKRHVNQGKSRVLIIVPSQEKVRDWVNDGRNLDLDIQSLDEVAKANGEAATRVKGKGVVITTFANARQNLKLLEDCFDLVVYDESQKIMEGKEADETTMFQFHKMLTNKDVESSIDRQTYYHPLWVRERNLMKEAEIVTKELVSGVKEDGEFLTPEERAKDEIRLNNVQVELAEIRKEQKPIRESKRAQAEKDTKVTKTVFLSATPFNTRENTKYAEGYIFSYPEEDKSTIGTYNHRSPEDAFYEQTFPAGYRWRYGRLEQSVSNAEALARQEIQFSDYLQNTLGTMSGRIIDSDYDYSRDFPALDMENKGRFNQGLNALRRDEKYRAIADVAWKALDYNYTTALFETMKTTLIMDRIKEHLKRGQKVVVFHRRRTGDVEPPFRRVMNAVEEVAELEEDVNRKTEMLSAAARFEADFADLFEWEQKINYTLPREQIAETFGEDNVAFYSGAENKKTKSQSIDDFMNDNAGKDIIVVQEASGKEGISLHDKTGLHQRVQINLSLPQSPIAFIQSEGRIYRIGQQSNAIFEYPLLGLDLEQVLFAQKFNGALGTTENLALGSKARNLRKSIAEAVLTNSGYIDYDEQGFGGKDMDGRVESSSSSGFDGAIQDYYGNQKLKSGRDGREGVDYFPTPEPIGYKMAEWAQLGEGETVLEPSAGHGAIARYVPESNGMTAIEPSQSLNGKLQLRAGGPGRKFLDINFEEYNIGNKHDVVLMNPPYGTNGVTAMNHVKKAFGHLNEGGRLIAIIPDGPAMDKKMAAWVEKSAVIVGEVKLPKTAFSRAGTSVSTKIVVIDKVSREEKRKGMPSKVEHDLSNINDVNDLFEAVRNIRMPERTIDEVAIIKKRAEASKKYFADNPALRFFEVDDEGNVYIRDKKGVLSYDITNDGQYYQPLRLYKESVDIINGNIPYEYRYSSFGRGKNKVEGKDAITEFAQASIKALSKIYNVPEDKIGDYLESKKAEEVMKHQREMQEREERMRERVRQQREAEQPTETPSTTADPTETPTDTQHNTPAETPSERIQRIKSLLKGGKSGAPTIFTYTPDKNTKTGENMHTVKMGNTVSDEDYKKINSAVKAHAGYWSRFKKAFVFPTEKDAKDFIEQMNATTRFKKKADGEDVTTRFRKLDEKKPEDKKVINELESGEKIKVYRAMALIDGKLYPPMATKIDSKTLQTPIELGKWERSEEKPDLAFKKANGRWYFKLRKDDGSTIDAAYNPYFHTSTTMLNDQFSSAQTRDNLVIVEVEVPKSELTSGYRAGKAKDAVGRLEWKAGVIQGQLSGTREVILSRYDKPVRIVPTEEVAGNIAKMLDGKVKVMPSNVVTKEQRAALEKHGIGFVETDNQGYLTDGSGKTYSQTYGKKTRFRKDDLAPTQQHGVEAAEKLAKQLNSEVEIVYDVSEISNPEVREAIKSGSRVSGWIEIRSGKPKVFIFAPHLNGAYDAEKTIAHEIVGHQGFRGLLGEKGYNDYMRGLYFDLHGEDFDNYMKDNLARNGFDIYRTVDEFIAEAVEKDYGDLSMWQKVRNTMTDGLRKMGFTMAPTISDVKYMAWLSKQQLIKGEPISEAKRAEILYKISKDRYRANHEFGRYTDDSYKPDGVYEAKGVPAFPGDSNIRFRMTPSAITAREQYERAINKASYVWSEAHVDHMKSAIEYAKAYGYDKIEDIPSHMNFLMAENLSSSTEEQMDFKLNKDYVMPVEDALNGIIYDMGKDADEGMHNTQLYMVKKHGLERNREFFVRDAIKNMDDKDMADTLRADWEQVVTKERADLKNGVIDLREYYEDLDDFIRRAIDPDYEASDNDYSGLTGTTGRKKGYDDASVITDVMVTEAILGEDRVNKLWEATKKLSDYGLDMEYDGGNITKAAHDHTKAMFEWYVPLRGFERESGEEHYDYLEDNNNDFNATTLMNAKGRKSGSDVDVIAQLGVMACNANSRFLRNDVKQRFARFVRSHYDVDGTKRLVTEMPYIWVEQVGTDNNGKPIYEERFPDIPEDATGDDVANIIEQFNQDMAAKKANGTAKALGQRSNIPYKPMTSEHFSQHVVEVSIGGRKTRFVFNGNPRAAQAINGRLNAKQLDSKIARCLNRFTKFMAQLNTSYSPDFVVRNTERDAIFAASSLLIKENAAYTGRWAKNYGQSVVKIDSLFRAYRNGTLSDSNPIHRYFREFMENGGETGWVDRKNLDKWKEIIKQASAGKTLGDKVVENVVLSLTRVIEAANERVENLARFATFMTSREEGRSAKRSAYDAKEISTNFNRKGAGRTSGTINDKKGKLAKLNAIVASETAGFLQDNIMFYNAGVQGVMNVVNNVKHHPVRGGLVLSAFLLGGLVMPNVNNFLASLYGEDDDEKQKRAYAELPDYVRRTALCVYAGDGRYITISLPIELRAMYGIGDLSAGLTINPELRPHENAGVEVMKQISQVLPLDFMGEMTGPQYAVVPSWVRPFYEASNNKNWMGQPIERDVTRWNKNDPRWKLAFQNTNDMYVNASKKLNSATNPYDDEDIKGWADGVLTDPALVQHVVEGYLGGAGTTVNRVLTMYTKANDGELTINNVPIARTFVYKPTERNKYARTDSKWWKMREEAEALREAHDVLSHKSSTDPLKAAQRIEMENSPEWKRAMVLSGSEKGYSRIQKAINKLQKAMGAEKDENRKKEIKEQIEIRKEQQRGIMRKAVEAVEQIK